MTDPKELLEGHLATGEPLGEEEVASIVSAGLAATNDFDMVGGGLYRHVSMQDDDEEGEEAGTVDDTIARIIEKHWLDGPHKGRPCALLDQEVELLVRHRPDQYSAEDFRERSEFYFWHVPTWYDADAGRWRCDEDGHPC